MSPSIAAPAYRPRPPFLGWPMQWCFDGGYAWLTPTGPAVVTQISATKVTAINVHSLQDIFDELVRARVTERLPGLCIIHDWRSIQSVDASARKAWGERTKRPGNPYREVKFYVAVNANPIVRMALKSAALAVQLAVGQRLAHFEDDPAEPIERLGITSPPADFLATWLRG